MPTPKNKSQRQESRSKRKGDSRQTENLSTHRAATDAAQSHALPIELMQIVLNVFQTALPSARNTDLGAVVQEVKGHLFNRDFSSAFAQPAYLEAYALRWSAARALGYASILTDSSRAYLLGVEQVAVGHRLDDAKPLNTVGHDEKSQEQLDPPQPQRRKALCIGGGAGAEIVALAVAHRAQSPATELDVEAIDSADWTEVVQSLSSALYKPPALSAHASEAAKAKLENQPLLDESYKTSIVFRHQDALEWDPASLQRSCADVRLCTIMFTLNELFSASLPKTTTLLLQITSSMQPGSHLFVIDSPGSYSEIQLRKGTDEGEGTKPAKKYPMKWLLDHTLLEVASEAGKAKWDKVESEDSLWFRIDQKDRARLRYPLELENMRYQLHCYRRL